MARWLNRLSLIPALSFFAAIVCCTAVHAADAPDSGRTPLRVLVVTGGHDFEKPQFFAMLDSLKDIRYDRAVTPQDLGLLQPGLEEKYDVILRYDVLRKATPEQEKALVALLEKGIGMVSLHHNLCSHDHWDEWRKILGGSYQREDAVIDGKKQPQSLWKHDQQIAVHVADREHPITRGVKDFFIHDETYGPHYVLPKAHLLLTTDNPDNQSAVAWTNQFGKSRIFYLQLGHDSQAWREPMYPKLVEQGLHWAAGK